MSEIRVAILSDSKLFSEGLKRILSGEPSFNFVGEDDGSTFNELLQSRSPHVLLVDGRMDLALSLLHRDGSRPWAIVLTGENDRDWAVGAIEAGARGVLPKTADAVALAKAISVVHDGQIWARSDVVAAVFEQFIRLSGFHEGEPSRIDGLSDREREIVRYSANGLSNKEIAQQLGISPATVKAHLTRIFQKVGVRGRAQLCASYYRDFAQNSRRPDASSQSTPPVRPS